MRIIKNINENSFNKKLVFYIDFFKIIYITGLIIIMIDYFTITTILFRVYVSPKEKEKISSIIPSFFDEIICELMLGDGNLCINGHHACLRVQQTHQELTQNL